VEDTAFELVAAQTWANRARPGPAEPHRPIAAAEGVLAAGDLSEEVREAGHPSEALHAGLRAAGLAAARRACVEIKQ
jgi:hypothetical protein